MQLFCACALRWLLLCHREQPKNSAELNQECNVVWGLKAYYFGNMSSFNVFSYLVMSWFWFRMIGEMFSMIIIRTRPLFHWVFEYLCSWILWLEMGLCGTCVPTMCFIFKVNNFEFNRLVHVHSALLPTSVGASWLEVNFSMTHWGNERIFVQEIYRAFSFAKRVGYVLNRWHGNIIFSSSFFL